LSWQDRRVGAQDQVGIKSSPVKIGDDVFIGANALILKGVTIGDRAIVGAGSVVARDAPEDEVWAGNPACMVRKNRSIEATL
jgi:acetyltransferase-like isoleucine patch superfamily enzyme